MKAASLLFLRVSTGLLLVVWGALRLMTPSAGPGLATKYYGGIAQAEWMQLGWGAILVAVGALTCLGLFRRVAYPAQALILVGGALAIWRYLLDPLGLYLLSPDDSKILFFPSICLAAATLALLAFREFDTLSLDRARARKR